METFQASLVGKQTTSITLGAGGSSYTCTDATTAKQITDAFSTCTTTCTSQSFSCNGVNWWIGKCGPGGEIGIGTSICSCSGTISIRPCINNNNWGGLGSNTCGQSSQTLSVTVNYSGKYYNLFLRNFMLIIISYVLDQTTNNLFLIYFSMIDKREREIKIQRVFVVGHRNLDLASDILIRRQREYVAKSAKDTHFDQILFE